LPRYHRTSSDNLARHRLSYHTASTHHLLHLYPNLILNLCWSSHWKLEVCLKLVKLSLNGLTSYLYRLFATRSTHGCHVAWIQLIGYILSMTTPKKTADTTTTSSGRGTNFRRHFAFFDF